MSNNEYSTKKKEDRNSSSILNSTQNKLEELICELMSIASSQGNVLVQKRCKNLLSDLHDEEYRITVVGQFSSGKSTFINALIGRDILPHGVSETTATITYIHNVKKDDVKRNKAVIRFSNQKIEEIDFNKDSKALVDYLTTTSKKYNVATEVLRVDIYVCFEGVESKVVIIDTPGLEGVTEGLMELTLEEVQHSDASICLFHIRGLSDADIPFFEYLQHFQRQLFFVLNGIDNLKESEGQSYAESLDTFKQQIKKHVHAQKDTPFYAYAISAMYALAAKDKTIHKMSDFDSSTLNDDLRASLWIKSHFESLQKDLFAYLAQSRLRILFYNQITTSLIKLVSNTLQGREQEYQLLLAKKEELPELKKLQSLMEEMNRKALANRKSLTNSMKAQLGDIEQNTKSLYKLSLEKKVSDIKCQIEKISSLDEYDKYTKQELPRFVATSWNTLCNQIEGKIMQSLNDVLDDLLGQIPEYIPNFVYTDISGKNIWDIKMQENVDSTIETNERVSQLVNRIEELKRKKKDTEDRIPMAEEHENQLKDVERSIRRTKQTYTSDKRSLGPRPNYRTWTTYHTVKQRTFIFFTKNVQEPEYHDNQSEIDNWDNRQEDIQRKYNKEIQKLYAVKNKLEKIAMEVSTNYLKDELIRIEANILKKEKELEEAKAEEEMRRRIAKTELLRRKKKTLSSAVESQLLSEWPTSINHDIRKNLEMNRDRMWEIVDRQYNQAKIDCQNRIELAIAKIEQGNTFKMQNETSLLKKHIQHLNDIINELKHLEYELSTI